MTTQELEQAETVPSSPSLAEVAGVLRRTSDLSEDIHMEGIAGWAIHEEDKDREASFKSSLEEDPWRCA